MMSHWLLIAGALAVFNALFLGIVLLLINSQLKNKLLGLLFVALALRTGKSVAITLFTGLPDTVPAIGLIGMASVGPLFLLYLQSLAKSEFVWSTIHWMHFIFTLVISVLLLWNSDALLYWLYVATAIQLVAYFACSFPYVLTATNENAKWLVSLYVALVIHCVVYASQIFVESDTAYLVSTIFIALCLYVLLFFLFRFQKVFNPTKQPAIDKIKAAELKTRLLQLMRDEKVYKQSDLIISSLATHLQIKPYVVSQVINTQFNQTFPEFVNEYRINEAKRLLLSSDFGKITIEGIAYECGYNTPSAFYLAFKKNTNLTPIAYRNQHELKAADV